MFGSMDFSDCIMERVCLQYISRVSPVPFLCMTVDLLSNSSSYAGHLSYVSIKVGAAGMIGQPGSIFHRHVYRRCLSSCQ